MKKVKSRYAENEPLPINPNEDIKVPAYVPEKLRADWIKHKKQILEYGKKSSKNEKKSTKTG